MPGKLSIDLDKTRVVLIGASDFEELPPIPAVENNIRDLRKTLIQKDVVGVAPDNILVLLNEEKPTDVATKLLRKLKEAEDTAIVYYAGHGLVGPESSELYLATKVAKAEEAEYSALRFEILRRAIRQSGARKKILILDCCFSGRALEIMGNEELLLQSQLDIKGTYAIASAPATRAALAPKGERYTTFSGQLLRILREGIDNDKEVITLNEIYESIRDESRRSNGPEPQRANFQDADQVAIAHNRRYKMESGDKIQRKITQLRKDLESHVKLVSDLDRRIEQLESDDATVEDEAGAEPNPATLLWRLCGRIPLTLYEEPKRLREILSNLHGNIYEWNRQYGMITTEEVLARIEAALEYLENAIADLSSQMDLKQTITSVNNLLENLRSALHAGPPLH